LLRRRRMPPRHSPRPIRDAKGQWLYHLWPVRRRNRSTGEKNRSWSLPRTGLRRQQFPCGQSGQDQPHRDPESAETTGEACCEKEEDGSSDQETTMRIAIIAVIAKSAKIELRVIRVYSQLRSFTLRPKPRVFMGRSECLANLELMQR